MSTRSLARPDGVRDPDRDSGSGTGPGSRPRHRETPPPLDEVSNKIIEQLQEDGRRPYAAIGKAVGLSEAAARERYAAVDIYRSHFKPLPYRVAGRDERMLMKLVVDGDTDRVLGCHFVGPNAAELVQVVAIAVKMGATKADFDATVALHPSMAEELVLLK